MKDPSPRTNVGPPTAPCLLHGVRTCLCERVVAAKLICYLLGCRRHGLRGRVGLPLPELPERTPPRSFREPCTDVHLPHILACSNKAVGVTPPTTARRYPPACGSFSLGAHLPRSQEGTAQCSSGHAPDRTNRSNQSSEPADRTR